MSKLLAAVTSMMVKPNRPHYSDNVKRRRVKSKRYDHLIRNGKPTPRLRLIARHVFFAIKIHEMGKAFANHINEVSQRKGFVRRLLDKQKECENA
jgi:hypothetical protein